ncbi:MAG: hypothetical protein US30_C0004G0138 [Candidatus Moranbacteria bacterium GW2011_GWF2_36_839]|nr:MAG: hypothetical protein US27_C0002G0141 [Candidatus Moranbacteria bacterium GW2011_GWF1_36_78]KKQ17394.1 MAG: hypothetical protein US30_C0004G0138 [Candidatus Moranbacteria bacterium GW2011_GWF2_36_839]HAT73764.1 hypothetical protein [Candidatus Moranbacteria bacterium]HBY11093.1 hypothetical protein [Candidatus Moranbacteria bacterium]
MKIFFTRKRIVIGAFVLFLTVGLFYLFNFAMANKKLIALNSLATINKFSNFLPIPDDEKKELDVINTLAQNFSKKDGVTRTFMIMLQNNMELRPGGGFLGQYAILKIKDGEVISTFFEDANLLDQKITAKIKPPYPFTRMMQLKKWKFRDSNFSPDFPTNVEKAKYFYRLAGRNSNFDGVIAVNTNVFNDILALTGPITVPGYGVTFNSADGALKLEEYVEKRYIMNPDIDTQNRKDIMRKMAPIIVEKLFSLGNISKISDLVHKEFQNRNIMVNFNDPNLQSAIESVYWDGKVATGWNSDYLMMVDANMGALKTDYYIKRQVNYDIDLTTEKPTVTLNILYKNTAPYGDWRTSDYHSYLRVYVPKGSNFLESKMVSLANKGEEFEKSYFGFICHVLIGGETNAIIKYELPDGFDVNDYRLLIQKQSGVENIPFKVHLKTKDGEYNQEQMLDKDLKFEFK